MMYRALISIFLCMAVFQVSAKGEYADLTNVEFSIFKNGEELHKGSMLLLDGKEATQTLYADSEQPSHRIIVTSGRQMLESKEQVVLDFQYLSYDGADWTTVVNSKITSYPNEEAVLSMGSKSNSVDISVIATTKDYEVLKSDDRVVNHKDCDSSSTKVVQRGSSCCGGNCDPGSYGDRMTCCGSFGTTCCACGICCSIE